MKYKYSIFQAEEGLNSLHGEKIGKIIILHYLFIS